MNSRDQITLLKKSADDTNSIIMKRNLNSDFKNQWTVFYQTLTAFSQIDDSTLAQNPVATADEIATMKAKLNVWKESAKNLIGATFTSKPKGSALAIVAIGLGIGLLFMKGK